MFIGLRDSRHERRTLLNIIAALIIATSVVMGAVYIGLFQSAASDLTRILPERTAAWLAAPAPWPRLARVVGLDRWANPEAVQRVVYGGAIADRPHEPDVAGIPMQLLREIARTMDGFEVAVIPGDGEVEGGAAVVVFVEISDPLKRKRLLSRLYERTDAADRHVGYRIDALRENVWQRWAGARPGPPRVVFMDPWIVFAWGSNRALEDLLDARVEGRVDAIRRRRGFIDVTERGEIHGTIDLTTVWRYLTHPHAPSKAEPMAPDGLFSSLELLTFATAIDDQGDRLDVRADIGNRPLAEALADGFRSAPHELLALGPADSQFALSVSGVSPAPAVVAMLAAAEHIGRDFPDFMPKLSNLAQLPGVGSQGRVDLVPLLTRLGARAFESLPIGTPSTATERQPFEAAFFVLAPPSDEPKAAHPEWLLLVRSDNAEKLEGDLVAALVARLGDDFALGEIAIPDGSLFALADPNGNPVVVWQRRLGLLEFAGTAATLDRMATDRARQHTLGAVYTLADAEAALKPERGLTLFWPNMRLRDSRNPFIRVIAGELAHDFPWLVTANVIDTRLHLQSNVGAWTTLAALATAAPRQLDSVFLPGLDAVCRARHDAMCEVWPASPTCQPFELGRFPRIKRACDALTSSKVR